jgi:hypothetical protein
VAPAGSSVSECSDGYRPLSGEPGYRPISAGNPPLYDAHAAFAFGQQQQQQQYQHGLPPPPPEKDPRFASGYVELPGAAHGDEKGIVELPG